MISNKKEGLSRRLLEELGLSHHFDIVLGSDSVDERKPSPKPLLHIMGQLMVGPEEAVIVGDSQYDIQAGKAAGIKTIAVTYGYRGKRFLTAADLMIERMEYLPSELEKLGQDRS